MIFIRNVKWKNHFHLDISALNAVDKNISIMTLKNVKNVIMDNISTRICTNVDIKMVIIKLILKHLQN